MWRLLLVLGACLVHKTAAFELVGSEGHVLITDNYKPQTDIPMITAAVGTAVAAGNALAVGPNAANTPFTTTNDVLDTAVGAMNMAAGTSISITPATDAIFTTESATKATSSGATIVYNGMDAGDSSGVFQATYGKQCVLFGTCSLSTNFTVTVSDFSAGTYYDFVTYEHTTGGDNYFYLSFACPFEFMKLRTSADIQLATGTARFHSA